MSHREFHTHLGVAALIGKVASMDQDVPLGQFDRAVVCVGDADEPCPPQNPGRRRHACGENACSSRVFCKVWQLSEWL